MKRVVSIVASIAAAISLLGLFAYLVNGKHIAVLAPSGEVANEQRQILFFALFLSSLVVIPVFTLLVFFSIRYRKGNKKARYTPEWGEDRRLEGLWWGIPILIIGVLGVVTFQTSHSLDPYKARAGGEPLEVQVIALRWKWLFIYPDQNVATLNHLPIPVDQPIKFSMTADAPMSAFWIPSLGSQIYAMNGMSSELNLKANEIGKYTGYTTNINGEGYAKMTFAANVLSRQDFDTWQANAKMSTDVLDMKLYDKLSEPKSDQSEKTYSVDGSSMFESIMKKYGHSMHHMETSS